jgi:hypothetical protein
MGFSALFFFSLSRTFPYHPVRARTFQYFHNRNLQTQQTPNQKNNPKQACQHSIFSIVVTTARNLTLKTRA